MKTKRKKVTKINPVARAMLRQRTSPKIIPNKKKNWKPEISLDSN